MTTNQRKALVESLRADFQSAVNANSQDVAVWMNLAARYGQIGANVNWYFCVRKAAECPAPLKVEPKYEAVEAVA